MQAHSKIHFTAQCFVVMYCYLYHSTVKKKPSAILNCCFLFKLQELAILICEDFLHVGLAIRTAMLKTASIYRKIIAVLVIFYSLYAQNIHLHEYARHLRF